MKRILALLVSLLVCQFASAQVPTIKSFTPTSGTSGTTVTVKGTNFSTTPANNVVFIGQNRTNVSASTDTTVTVTLPVGLSHPPYIRYANTLSGLSALSSLPFQNTFTGLFSANIYDTKSTYVTETSPRSIRSGDFDGDNKPDMVVLNYSSSSFSVFRNTSSLGSISFAVKSDYAVGPGYAPYQVRIADIDNDHKLDIIVSNLAFSSVSIFRNISTTGNISFATRVNLTTGTSPSGLSIGDLDADGKLDIAVANAASNTVSILRNTSSAGSISFASKQDFAVGSNPYGVEIADIDGDGKLDVCTANFTSTNVSILRNTSTSSISFATKVDIGVTNAPIAIYAEDIDGDSKKDLVFGTNSALSIGIFRNTSTPGSISLATGSFLNTTSGSPLTLAIADLNGDGKSDIVAGNNSNQTAFLLKNNSTSGTLSFDPKIDLSIGGSGVQDVCAVDIDGDAKTDLAFANWNNNYFTALLNNTVPKIKSVPASPSGTTTCIIVGVNFTGATDVSIGGVSVPYSITNDGLIIATVSSANSGAVVVTTPFGVSNSNFNFNFRQNISSFSPTYDTTQSTITISGTGFNTNPANNLVYMGQKRIPVTSASASNLTVQVPKGMVFLPSITVIDSLSKYTSTASKPFQLKFSGLLNANCFDPRVNISTATSPLTMTSGDLDGDGKPELISAGQTSNTISIIRNTSSIGSISGATAISLGSGFFYQIVLNDINSDGKLDLVTTSVNSNIVSIFLNTSSIGSITFAPKIDFVTGATPQGLVVADLDQDGLDDIVVVNNGNNTISILRNISVNGSVAFEESINLFTGSSPRFIKAADLDGDNKPELVVSNFGGGNISVYRNTSTYGLITFASRADITTSTQPTSIEIADVDGNGLSDVFVANSGSISVLRNTSTLGSVSFVQTTISSVISPTFIAFADLDGDSKNDLIVSNSFSNTLHFFQNNSTVGNISFNTPFSFSVGSSLNVVQIVDMDSDGRPDVGVISFSFGSVSFYRNNPLPRISEAVSTAIGSATMNIFGTNFTGATQVSIGGTNVSFVVNSNTQITANITSSTTGLVVVKTPTGSSTENVSFRFRPNVVSFTPLADTIQSTVTISGTGFNSTLAHNKVWLGNKRTNVISGSSTSLTIQVPTGTSYQPNFQVLDSIQRLSHTGNLPFRIRFNGLLASGTFDPKIDFATATTPSGSASGDLNGDGKPEVVVVNQSSNSISLFRNTSSGSTISFASKTDLSVSISPRAVRVGDIDNDGKLDIIVVNGNANTVSIFRNTTTSLTLSFASVLNFSVGSTPVSIALADIDGDGKQEIIATNSFGSSIAVLRNTSVPGTIAMSTALFFSTGSTPNFVSCGDIDGDGRVDVAVCNGGSSSVSLLRNTSSGGLISFASASTVSVGASPVSVQLGDLDDDGDLDIVTANQGSSTISYYRNQSISGSFTLGTVTNINTTASPNSMVIGDVDGDGKPDVLSLSSSSNQVSMHPNTSSSGISFGTRVDISTTNGPSFIQLADINADGKPDITTVNATPSTFSVYRNNPLPKITEVPIALAGISTISVKGFNFTGTTSVTIGGISVPYTVTSSENLQLTVSPVNSGLVIVNTPLGSDTGNTPFYFNPSIASFTPTYDTTGSTLTIKGAGFSDTLSNNRVFIGKVSATVLSGSTDSLKVTVPSALSYPNNISLLHTSKRANIRTNLPFRLNYNGSINTSFLDSKIDFSTGSLLSGLNTADFDGDGKVDVVSSNSSSSVLSVFRNTSSGASINFATRVDLTIGSTPRQTALGDVNGDGKIDIVCASGLSNSVSVFLNQSSVGTISFATKVDYELGNLSSFVELVDLDLDGKLDIVSTNGGNLSVFRNTSVNGSMSFASRVDISTIYTLTSLAFGDVTEDGFPDLMAGSTSSNLLLVFKNLSVPGNIAFGTNVNYSVGSSPRSIFTGDVDGDSKPDVLVANSSANSISVFRNTTTSGTVSFAAATTLSSLGMSMWVTLADMNGDGKSDVVVANQSTASVVIIQNNSTIGSLSFNTAIGFATGTSPAVVTIADIDADKRPDVLIGNTGLTNFSVLRNNPLPIITSFTPESGITGTSVTITGRNFVNVSSINIGLTPVVSYTVNSATSIILQVPSGAEGLISITTTVGIATSSKPFLIRPQITAFSPSSGAVGSVVTIKGKDFNSTISSGTVLFGQTFATILSATDTTLSVRVPAGATYLQNITYTDLATGLSDRTKTYFNTSFNGLIESTSLNRSVFASGTNLPISFAMGDFDGDGKPDMAAVNNTGNSITIHRNTSTIGNITYSNKLDIGLPAAGRSIETVDIDGDGKLDLVTTNSSGNTISIFRNTSTVSAISFATKIDFAAGSNPGFIRFGDLDDDGKVDLIVTNQSANSISIFKNLSSIGTISMASRQDVSTSFNTVNVQIVDLDNDSKLDIVYSVNSTNVISVLRNTTTNSISFATKVDFTVNSSGGSFAAADLDNNGKVDLVVTNPASSNLSIWMNTSTVGSISFSAKSDFSTAPSPSEVKIADFNGDNLQDIVVVNQSGLTNLSLFKNNSTIGTLSLGSRIDYGISSSTFAMGIADMDGDTLPDIVVGTPTATPYNFFRNNLLPVVSVANSQPVGTTQTTIVGLNFVGVSNVSIGGVSVPFVVNSISSIQVTINASTIGMVQVTTGFGVSNIDVPFYFKPSITGISTDSGFVGDTILITGNGFNSLASNNIVFFGKKQVPIISSTTSSLKVLVPAGVTYPIEIEVTDKQTSLSAKVIKPFRLKFNGLLNSNIFDPVVSFNVNSFPNYFASADFDGDGKLDMAVSSNSISSVAILRNISSSGSISFAPKSDIAVNSYQFSVAAGDVNGDGKPDLLVGNFNSSNISVFRNTSSVGSISFASKVDLSSLGNPYHLSLADIDGDGKLDLLVARSSSSVVSVLLNTSVNGSISFANPVNLTVGNTPIFVGTADVDGDLKLDIVAVNNGSNTISVLKNNSFPGTISVATKVDFSTLQWPTYVSFADLNLDGKMDLLVSNSGSSSFSVFRNQSSSGTISMATRSDISSTYNNEPLCVADFNGDGKSDVVLTTNTSIISVYPNNSTTANISFGTKIDYSIGFNTNEANVADVDGDGRPDLLLTNTTLNTLSAYRYNIAPSITSFTPNSGKAGTIITITGRNFTGATSVLIGSTNVSSFTVVNSTTITATMPLTGTRGLIKVTTSQGTATSISNFTYIPFIESFTPASASAGASVVLKGSGFNPTLNKNLVQLGETMAMVTQRTDTTLTFTVPKSINYVPFLSVTDTSTGLSASSFKPLNIVFTGLFNANTFNPKVDIGSLSNANGTALGDIDGDGKPDLATTRFTDNIVSVSRNTSTLGSVSFGTASNISTGSQAKAVILGDLNGDGKNDLVVGSYASNRISFFKNTSTVANISFGTALNSTSSTPNALTLVDLNLDGKKDLVVANFSSGNFSVHQNFSDLSTISIAGAQSISVGGTITSVSYGDYDSDGRTDVVAASSSLGRLSVYRNTSTNGSVSFAAAVNLTTGTTPSSIATDDVDGDGKLDIVATNQGSNTVSVFRNTSSVGSISFSTKTDFSTGSAPVSVKLSDVDGDGNADIIVANYSSNSVSVLKNTSTSGSISFQTKIDFTTGTNPNSVSVADVNGDGLPDIAAANASSSSVSVFLNNPYPSITSFAPSLGVTGDSVIVTGKNFIGTTQVLIGGTPASSFVVKSNTSIKAIVSSGSTGFISVITPVDTAISVSTFTYLVPPMVYNVTGGGSFCTGGSGVSIGLSGSELGVNYQLKRAAVSVGSPMSGTGSSLNFGLQTIAGNYSVIATNASNPLLTSTMNDTVTVIVNALLTPSVSIAGNHPSPICTGKQVTFTANPINGGLSPQFQWYLNGNPVGSDSISYTTNALNDQDVITLKLKSNAICRSIDSAFASPLLYAVDSSNTWVGTSGASWTIGSNWGCGNTPNALTNAKIPASSVVSIPNATAIQVKNLNISSGGTLNFAGTGTLTVFGNWIDSGSFNPGTGKVVFAGSNQTLNTVAKSGSTILFNDLQINTGAQVTLSTNSKVHILPNGTIELNGTLNLNNQTLVLRSDSGRAARLAELSGSATLSNASNFVVQRYITKRRRLRYLSSPVVNATLKQWKDSTLIVGPLAGGFDAPHNASTSLKRYNEASTLGINNAWVSESNVNNALVTGRGYYFFVVGKRNTVFPDSSEVVLALKGVPNQGPISLPVTFTTSGTLGWNLVGNPYPSQISWDAPGWTKTNIGDAIYMWDPSMGKSGNYYSYVNGVASDGRANGDVIGSSQAFFVKANAASPVLQITESAKVGDAHKGNFRREAPSDLIRIKLSYGNASDQAVLYLQDGATKTVDQTYDALKLNSSELNIFTVSDVKNQYSIQALPSNIDSFSVPLVMSSVYKGLHQLTVTDLKQSAQQKYYLIDQLNRTATPLFNGYVQTIDPTILGSDRFRVANYLESSVVTGSNAFKIESPSIMVYPNPFSTQLNVQSSQEDDLIQSVEIYTAEGALVYRKSSIYSAVCTINDFTNFVSGVYFVSVRSEKNRIVKMITKE